MVLELEVFNGGSMAGLRFRQATGQRLDFTACYDQIVGTLVHLVCLPAHHVGSCRQFIFTFSQLFRQDFGLSSVLIGKRKRYFFKFSFDCVHSPITNLIRYDKQVRYAEIKERDGTDAADGARCEAVYVVVIPLPAA